MTKVMPMDARVWIYQAAGRFSDEEVTRLKKQVTDFIENWTSHSKFVMATFELRYNQFLILLLDEHHVAAGGCSIDSSVHFIKSLETEYQNSLTDRMKFAFLRDEQVEVASKEEFEKLLAEGIITDDTIVFNNLVGTKAELDSIWKIPFQKSWHKNFFASKV